METEQFSRQIANADNEELQVWSGQLYSSTDGQTDGTTGVLSR